MSKFCKKCGTQIADDIEFCPKCGTSQNIILPKEEKVAPVKNEPGSAYSNSIPVTNESSKSIPTYVISIIAALVMVMGAFFIVFHGDIGEVKALFSSNVATSEESKPTVSDNKNNESSEEKKEKSNNAENTAVKNTYNVTYRIPSKNAPINLSSNHMTVHVGECIYVNIAPDSVDPGKLRWMTHSSPSDNDIVKIETLDGGLGAKFTAVSSGEQDYQLVPNYGDWDRAAKFYITVVP